MKRSSLKFGLAAIVLAATACRSADESSADTQATFTTDGETDTEGDETGDDGNWSDEEEITLRIEDDAPPELTLNMDKDEVAELFGDVSDEILLLELETTPLLTNTLNEVKTACGTGWMLDNSDPQHDCDLTEVGQGFEGPDGTWRTSTEYALIRILTMTPANAKVEGTSIEGIQEVADFTGIGGGFAQILADTLQIDRTEEFLTTDVVVESLRQNLVATHPSALDDGRIPVTLADALEDLNPLAARFGPVGDHPGVLDPDFPVDSPVFTEEFEMKVVAESNIRVLDGVDLGAGKEFISVVSDVTGPTYDDEAEFDFADPAKFSMTGLSDSPTANLRFQIFEHDSFVPSCYQEGNCNENAPGNPVGDGTVWRQDTWDLEWIIAFGGTIKYEMLAHETCIVGCWMAEILVGQGGNPPGWAEFDVLFDIGDPPASQFVWELINEVAQVQLHETPFQTFPEGDADVEFTVFDVDVGMTGEEAAESVRPYLQDQASDIAGYLLGNYKEQSGPVDIYYRRADDGEPYLFFVAPEDLVEGADYGWANPGFFGDSSLSDKVSGTELPGVGEMNHEKLAVGTGERTVYLEDDDGELYRVRLVAGEDLTEITAYVSHSVDG